ncbi:MAG: response regulator [Thermoflexus sp.]|jgi:CheY-like chemotaxis protein|nr:response regulator [Thermoflexus sp.]MDT7884652.1 response regulator [Thermoflexus sp.]MDT7947040.1 response regulator [Thermoflexus sp.]
MRLLIVEQNPDMRLLYRIGLRNVPWEILEAGTMADALEQVTARHPDIVLIGEELPDGDPFELCARIKSNPETRDIVVAIAVYYMDGLVRRRSQEVEADACWLGPIPPRELPKRLEELYHQVRQAVAGGNNGSSNRPPQG